MEEFSRTIIELKHICTIKPRFSGPWYIKFFDRQCTGCGDKIAWSQLCATEWIV